MCEGGRRVMMVIFGFGVVVALLGIGVLTPLALGAKNQTMATALHDGFKVCATVGFASLMIGALMVLTK
jgi:hypothetical protein